MIQVFDVLIIICILNIFKYIILHSEYLTIKQWNARYCIGKKDRINQGTLVLLMHQLKVPTLYSLDPRWIVIMKIARLKCFLYLYHIKHKRKNIIKYIFDLKEFSISKLKVVS